MAKAVKNAVRKKRKNVRMLKKARHIFRLPLTIH